MYDATKTRTVLLIEDSAVLAETITTVLELEGYSVMVAENGAVGLEILRAATHLPSRILLDLSMPVMCGRRFRELQKQDLRLASIPVTVMSGEESFDEFAAQREGVGLLRKPDELDELIELLVWNYREVDE